jgi:hypothetical protein
MPKTLLVLLLIAMSTCTAAEWVRLWGNDVLEGYVEPDSIRMKGKSVVTQNMFDMKKASEYNGNEYHSSVLSYEFDCTKERARSLESIFYAEHNGAGAIVDSWSSPYEWKVVFPETPLHSFMTYACRNR